MIIRASVSYTHLFLLFFFMLCFIFVAFGLYYLGLSTYWTSHIVALQYTYLYISLGDSDIVLLVNCLQKSLLYIIYNYPVIVVYFLLQCPNSRTLTFVQLFTWGFQLAFNWPLGHTLPPPQHIYTSNISVQIYTLSRQGRRLEDLETLGSRTHTGRPPNNRLGPALDLRCCLFKYSLL